MLHLRRRFQPVNIGEPNNDDTISIIHGLQDLYENTTTPCQAAIPRLLLRFQPHIQDRFLPGTRLLTSLMSWRLVHHKMSLPPEIALGRCR